MFRTRPVARFINRLKHGVVASAFVATQLALPMGALGLFVGHAAAAGFSMEQCQNGTVTSPNACAGASNWITGNSNASKSHWREGDSIPYRSTVTGLSAGMHTLTIAWDTTVGGKHALDYITSYNRTETTADPCSDVSGCSTTPPPSTFAIPADPNVTGLGVTPASGNFTLYHGTITGVSAYSLSGSYSGNSTTSITVTFTTTGSNTTVVLAWGGHIASQINWGLGNSASAINGSPYHTSLAGSSEGSTGSKDVQLMASAVLPTPTITTQASTATAYVGQNVTDTASLSGPNSPLKGTVSFFVCGPSASAPDCTAGGTQVGSAVPVSPGTGTSGTATSAAYAVASAGTYCFRAEYVPSADSPYSPQNHTNTDTECFTATVQPGSITIIKDAVPQSSQDFSFTTTGTGLSPFSLDDDNDSTLSNTQTFNNLAPGSYSVTEQATTGWDFDNISCSQGASVTKNGPTVTISLSAGQSVSCTYTNRQRAHLIVNKVTDPANDPTGFSVTASGTPTASGATAINGNATQTVTTSQPVTYDVAQGTYSVTETVPSGWHQTGNTCTDLTIDGNTPLVNGVPTVSCTITNTKLAKITIVKQTDPASSDQLFSFTPSSNLSGSNFSLDTDSGTATPGSQTFANLTPGQTYTVTEDAQSGWQLTGLTCSSGFTWNGSGSTVTLTPAAGDDITCIYTNTQLGSIGGYKYDVNAGAVSGGTYNSPVQNWTVYLLVNGTVKDQTTTAADGSYSFNDLLPDNYTLAECLNVGDGCSGWTQIYGAAPVTLTAGQQATNEDFGNFKNASISGYKFNDLNDNGSWDSGEPALSNWTINLTGTPTAGGSVSTSATTDGSGYYSFGDLAPGDYTVCEKVDSQPGYVQTAPTANNGCYDVTVALSGHDYTGNNFGNQGQGTITVTKVVNNDNGGKLGPADFTLQVNGQTVTSGTTNTYAAGDYTVDETDPTSLGYRQVSLTCTDGNQQSVGANFTLSPAENVSCVITNQDVAPTLTLKKIVSGGTATQDNFQATINGADASWDQTYTVNAAQAYTLGEFALAGGEGYTGGSWSCDGGALSGNQITLALADDVTCTITNTRDTGTVAVNKVINPSNDSGLFNLTITGPTNFTAYNQSNGGTTGPQTVDTGSYTVSETAGLGSDLADYSSAYGCYLNGSNTPFVTGSVTTSDSFNVAKGDSVICTFTNTRYGSISGTKYEVNADGTIAQNQDGSNKTLAGWTICVDANNNGVCDPGEATQTTGSDGSFSFSKLLPGVYKLIETIKDGWTQIFGNGSVTLSAGQNSTGNDFGNFENGSISGIKFDDHNGNGVKDSADENLTGWTITLNGTTDMQQTVSQSAVTDAGGAYSFTDLAPGTYQVCEVGQTGWSQTLPGGNGCYTEVIDQSGEADTANFGNQGYGTITVSKNLDDGFGNVTQDVSGWTWNFDGTYGSGDHKGASTQHHVIVAAGDYSITENNQDNYHFGSLVCDQVNQNGSTGSVTVTPGSNVSCVYTNVRDTGTLVLKKHVINNNGGTATAADFTLHVTQNGTDVTGSPAAGSETGTSYDLTTGTYTVSENTPPTGYTQTSIVCDGHVTATVTVTSGDSKTCVITNDDVAPKLTLVKYVTNDNGGKAQPTDFTLSATPEDNQFQALSGPGGASGTIQANQNYDLSETNLSGYAPSGWFCGVGANLSGSTINLAPGADVTCSITNDDVAPLITVTKTVINDNGGQLQVSDFPLYVGNLQVTSGTQASIDAGTYQVSEVGNANYQASSWTGDCDSLGNITMVVGGVYNCYITNDDIAPQLTVIKHVVNDNTNLTKTASDFTMLVDGTDVSSSQFPGSENGTTVTLNAGTYGVSEQADSDYTATYSADCSGSIDIGQQKTCTVTNTAILKPGIHVVKSGPATAYEGDTVTYTFDVTNTGNTPLSLDSVNDDVAGAGTYVSGDTNHNNLLDVDETWEYTADYTVPAGSGDITNTVTVCGSDVADAQVCDNDHHTTHIYHPYITVTKYVYTTQPSDDGTFNLQVDGTTKATGGDGTTTNNVLVAPGDDHTVGETGANGTDLSDYDSETYCYNESAEYYDDVATTSLSGIPVSGDQHVYCYIYNVRHAHLTIVKDAVPNDPQPFTFTLQQYDQCEEVEVATLTNLTDQQCDTWSPVDSFQLVDNTDPSLASKLESLSAFSDGGTTYRVTEAATSGWDLTSLDCGDVDVTYDGAAATLTLEPGQNVTCTYTNTKRASLTIRKDARPNSLQMFNFTSDVPGADSFSLMDDGTNNANGKTMANLLPGTYTVTEAASDNWTLDGVTCGQGVTMSLNSRTLTVTLAPGANVTCTFTNAQGAVLGASTVTPLVNTGDNPFAYVTAAIMLLLAALGIRFGRRPGQA